MDKKETKFGKWWLPERTDKKLHGKLDFGIRSGCDLEIEKAFPGFENDLSHGPNLVIGRAEDGTKYSLIDSRCRGISYAIGTSMQDKKPTKSRFHATYLLEGKQLSKYEDFVFDEAKVAYSYLNQWMWATNIKKPHFDSPLIEWGNHEPELIASIPGCKILKELIVNETHYDRPARGYKVTNQWYITFKFDGPSTIAVVWDTIRKFQRLIVFSTQRPIAIQELLVKFPTEQFIYPLSLKQPIESNEDEEFLGGYDYLFRFVEHENRASLVIQKWYQIYENFGAILDSYLAIFYSEIVFTEAEFLTYAQCLEALHRGIETLEVIPKDVANEICKKMLATVPAEYLEIIRQKLSHIHESSFINRIMAMYNTTYLPLSATPIRISNDQFKKIRDTRNFYTHFDRRLRDKILKNTDLFNINRALNIVLIIYLLKQLGFSTPEIVTQIKRIT